MDLNDDMASGKFGHENTEENSRNMNGFGDGGHDQNKLVGSPLTTLDEARNERSNLTHSVSTILNTAENIQEAANEFSEHISDLNITFKNEIVKKIKDLKRADTQLLTERIEELKGEEGTELSQKNQIYVEKKLRARHLEQKVS